MSSLLFRELCNIPFVFLIGFTAVRSFGIRKKKLFFTVFLVLICLITLVPTESALRPLLTLLVFAVCFPVFGNQKPLPGIFGSVLLYLVALLSEIVAGVLTLLICKETATESFIETNQRAMVAMQLVFWLVLALLCFVFERIWTRKSRTAHEKEYRNFWLLPVSQSVILGFSIIFAVIKESGLFIYLFLAVETGLFFFADLLLVRMIEAVSEKKKAEERAGILKKQVEEETVFYKAKADEIRKVSKLRHDIRNQLETARILSEQGENLKAAAQYDEMLTYLDETGKGAGL